MSDLTTRGSTRRWRTRRAAWAQQLAYLGTVPCWRHEHNRDRIRLGINSGQVAPPVDQSPHCTFTITHSQPWRLGHRTDRATGGTDAGLGYECVPCSNHTGGKTGSRLRNLMQTAFERRAW